MMPELICLSASDPPRKPHSPSASLSEEHRRQIQEAFALFDLDQIGEIKALEVSDAIETLGLRMNPREVLITW